MARQKQRVRSERPKISEKFEQQRLSVPPLVAMNERQKEYIRYLRQKDLILATGYAGTAKTYIPTVMAADALRANKTDRIVITRPAISNSRSLGFFSGTVEEKMGNWTIPVLNILKQRMGAGAVEIAIKRGTIQFLPFETVKGFSAENCWFLCDEAEDMTIEEAKKLVTRQGSNCKMVLSGDCSQSELREDNGLSYLLRVARKASLTDDINLNVGVIDFNSYDDIVRSETCKEWIIAMDLFDKR